MVIIAAAFIFAEIQHFRAEAHWLKVGAVSVCFDFVGIGRINIRNVGRIIKAINPNRQLAITIVRGRQFLLVGEFIIDTKSTPPSANSDSLEVDASELDSVEFELESEGSANAE